MSAATSLISGALLVSTVRCVELAYGACASGVELANDIKGTLPFPVRVGSTGSAKGRDSLAALHLQGGHRSSMRRASCVGFGVGKHAQLGRLHDRRYRRLSPILRRITICKQRPPFQLPRKYLNTTNRPVVPIGFEPAGHRQQRHWHKTLSLSETCFVDPVSATFDLAIGTEGASRRHRRRPTHKSTENGYTPIAFGHPTRDGHQPTQKCLLLSYPFFSSTTTNLSANLHACHRHRRLLTMCATASIKATTNTW
ncbi:hypothetical protein K458DRAFT_451638 [Lentithecium fluviatile CBS 122367]|uniref:Secreted protein n=1 Tax=Lentithecium fluviatile CBS 122367 TaxID=1168545 RepID=A0A6G1J0V7_9PLEO|nr:hypothetical protein K458DRAFT_451638 [Lentithecium fluviatile CBS 122367]